MCSISSLGDAPRRHANAGTLIFVFCQDPVRTASVNEDFPVKFISVLEAGRSRTMPKIFRINTQI